MKDKRGFTLIELLAVIAIIALISMIAIPNIVNLSDGIKRDNMLSDAKKLISMAKYQVKTDFELRNFTKTGVCVSEVCTLYFDTLNVNGDIKTDPDDGSYNAEASYVKYYKSNNTITYCIVLVGSKRHIGSNTDCKLESELQSKSNVQLN